MTRPLMPSLIEAVAFVTGRLFDRVDGLTREEYLWEPVPDGWSVRADGDVWVIDWAHPAPTPAPVTTIAWRLWHITNCLASYVQTRGGWPLSVSKLADGRPVWFGDVSPAVDELHVAVDTFTERVQALGEDGLHQPLGPAWGQYADSSWADLVIHAIDEVSHHGAEVALLRDLYPRLQVR